MRPASAWILLTSLLATGCTSGEVDDVSETGAEAPLVNAALDTTHPNVLHVTSQTGPRSPGGKIPIYSCTGSLIAPHTVLTAAHCIVASKELTRAATDPGHKFRVREIAIHPQYRHGEEHHDLAVLPRTEDVTGIEPAWLLPVAPIAREPITLVGYGRNDAGELDDQRRSGTTTISAVRATYLLSRYTHPGRPAVDDSDSGGPGFVVRGGRERLAGVASTATGECGFLFVDCTSNQHTRVDLNLGWIVDQMDEPPYDGGAYDRTPLPPPVP